MYRSGTNRRVTKKSAGDNGTKTPIERELCDVVPPDVPVDRVMRIVCPTIAYVPEPFLAPKADLEIKKNTKIQGTEKNNPINKWFLTF